MEVGAVRAVGPESIVGVEVPIDTVVEVVAGADELGSGIVVVMHLLTVEAEVQNDRAGEAVGADEMGAGIVVCL